MNEGALARAADSIADAARFVRDAQHALERGRDGEAQDFAAAAKHAAEHAAFELRDAK